MVRIIIALLFCFPVALSAQTYQQLSEKAIECIEKDSFHRAEELLLQALKLEPKNAKNALLFSNLGLVQRRLGEYDKALESYSFALNFAPLAVPILLDRAAIYMETGRTDRAYTDYCRVLDEDKQNKEALLMRAYIYILRRDYPAARIDYNRLLELDPQSYSGSRFLVFIPLPNCNGQINTSHSPTAIRTSGTRPMKMTSLASYCLSLSEAPPPIINSLTPGTCSLIAGKQCSIK